MFRDHPRFAPWRSRLWAAWRAVEKDGQTPFRFCRTCGFVHRRGNHAPKKEAIA